MPPPKFWDVTPTALPGHGATPTTAGLKASTLSASTLEHSLQLDPVARLADEPTQFPRSPSRDRSLLSGHQSPKKAAQAGDRLVITHKRSRRPPRPHPTNQGAGGGFVHFPHSA